MNNELRELIRKIITEGDLNKRLVTLTYEVDESHREILERVSIVYETTDLKEGFD